ncbi:Bor family protein [Longimicrobium terrae]|uniref:Lipoprotein n=1 Tax=Longimicrobium terrae TaxID=1639882 RepID=A0A841H6B8_9BACT|nr:Bor family protein [Longimicrobium terrae]MBB4639394.1 hypothetical protein [Longimicrobium terrae]MBB6073701.1 hypothetical protein [Longimicrobium terrae]NNC30646.1 hypothetical protein [Longimicrobium terrae]
MRIKSHLLAAPALVFALDGCYHATVDTGRTPNGVEVKKEWAHSFIAGLVPPSTVETASQCPNGVAKVETQQSFLNLVANVLTGGIYSPMTITVQCAGATAMNLDAPVLQATSTDAAATMNRAVEVASETGEAVYVRFGR